MPSHTDAPDNPPPPGPRRIAVLGAGLAGLTAAGNLHARGLAVTIFDKGRGVGGRMSRRRRDPFAFDHGAQYFTARDPAFRRQVETWARDGIVARWNARFARIDGDRVSPHPDVERFVGTPGMNALARHLAAGLRVDSNRHITRVSRDAGTWTLHDADGPVGRFDALVSSLPAGQAATLLGDLSPVAATAAACPMHPCWAVLLGFDQPLATSFDAAHVRPGPLAWIARNNSKPGRDAAESWVLHATPAWSAEHFEDPPERVIAALTEAFGQLPGVQPPPPRFRDAMRWKFALAPEPLACGALWDPDRSLALCGDWCATARIEGAWQSGLAAAVQAGG